MVVVQRLLRQQNFPTRPTGWVVLIVLMLGLAIPKQTQAQDRPRQIEFLKYGAMATHVALSSNGEYVAAGLREASNPGGRVVLWSRSEGEQVWSQSFPTENAPDVAFDSTGRRLVVATDRGNVRVWNLTQGSSDQPRETGAPVSDVRFGSGGMLGTGVDLRGVEGTRHRGAVRVWTNGMDNSYTSLQTNAPVRTLAFRPNASEVVFADSPSTVTIWNYRINTTRTLDTAELCGRSVAELQVPTTSNRIYLTTQAEATCDPDYLCVLDGRENSLVRKYQRKNIDQIEPLGNNEIAYSRGRYVYRVNVQTGVEEIIFDSDNTVQDLAYINGTLAVANSNVVLLEL